MQIAIIGAGNVGKPLARALAAAGHEIRLANSRGPESIRDLATSLGATATTAADAVAGADVIIVSVPPTSVAALRELLASVPQDVPVIDTGNYHPKRDGQITALDAGQVEAIWTSEQLGRPITKAWNCVTSMSLEEAGSPAGTPGRIALPVAGDDPAATRLAMTLTDLTGFDAVDVGSLQDSWRLQPGNPAYCTELPKEALRDAVARADADQAPARRDLSYEIGLTWGEFSRQPVVRLNRAVTLTPDPQ